MKKLRIGVIDLVSSGESRSLWSWVMYANFSSIMPQALAVWCEEEGHEVTYRCYTGHGQAGTALPDNLDIVFIGAFTEAAELAYALSNSLRARGVVTALGGPHARCYPQDAEKYFDYVFGFTSRTVLREVLDDCSQYRPVGRYVSSPAQPTDLPGLTQRWKFVEQALKNAPWIKVVPMIGSLGCPYTCSFCIDSTVAYQPLDFESMRSDLRFLQSKIRRPIVAWHDPNFGIQFDATMDAMEEAVRPGSIEFIAESSLSILTEPHIRRLSHNGFKALLPGVESWYELGNKSRTGQTNGLEKVRDIAEHVNLVLRYVPYVQTNFVLGLDSDRGPEPFELTKRFIDLAPGAFPGYSLLTAFGQAAPVNLEYQRAGRVIPFPFHFLNNNQAMNLKPWNYSWPAFYKHVMDLTAYSFSPRAIAHRLRAGRGTVPRALNLIRGFSSEARGRMRFYSEIYHRLASDRQFRLFFEQGTSQVPSFYTDRIRRDLRGMWDWLPAGALSHDVNAYLKAVARQGQIEVSPVPKAG